MDAKPDMKNLEESFSRELEKARNYISQREEDILLKERKLKEEMEKLELVKIKKHQFEVTIHDRTSQLPFQDQVRFRMEKLSKEYDTLRALHNGLLHQCEKLDQKVIEFSLFLSDNASRYSEFQQKKQVLENELRDLERKKTKGKKLKQINEVQLKLKQLAAGFEPHQNEIQRWERKLSSLEHLIKDKYKDFQCLQQQYNKRKPPLLFHSTIDERIQNLNHKTNFEEKIDKQLYTGYFSLLDSNFIKREADLKQREAYIAMKESEWKFFEKSVQYHEIVKTYRQLEEKMEKIREKEELLKNVMPEQTCHEVELQQRESEYLKRKLELEEQFSKLRDRELRLDDREAELNDLEDELIEREAELESFRSTNTSYNQNYTSSNKDPKSPIKRRGYHKNKKLLKCSQESMDMLNVESSSVERKVDGPQSKRISISPTSSTHSKISSSLTIKSGRVTTASGHSRQSDRNLDKNDSISEISSKSASSITSIQSLSYAEGEIHSIWGQSEKSSLVYESTEKKIAEYDMNSEETESNTSGEYETFLSLIRSPTSRLNNNLLDEDHRKFGQNNSLQHSPLRKLLPDPIDDKPASNIPYMVQDSGVGKQEIVNVMNIQNHHSQSDEVTVEQVGQKKSNNETYRNFHVLKNVNTVKILQSDSTLPTSSFAPSSTTSQPLQKEKSVPSIHDSIGQIHVSEKIKSSTPLILDTPNLSSRSFDGSELDSIESEPNIHLYTIQWNSQTSRFDRVPIPR